MFHSTGRERVEIAGDQAVRGDDEVGVVEPEQCGTAALTFGSVVHDDTHRRREPGGLGLPVVDHAQRAHDEVRPRPLDEVGERGGGLAETHVVGEAAAEAEPGEELHPGQAAALVVAQLALERAGLVHLLEALVGQPGEEVVDPSVGSVEALVDALDCRVFDRRRRATSL